MTKPMVVPPGGFAGYSSMTPASKQALSSGLRLQRATKSRSGKKAKKRYARNNRAIAGKNVRMPGSKKKKRSGSGTKKTAKLVKGSLAAKKFMAALRKRRKK